MFKHTPLTLLVLTAGLVLAGTGCSKQARTARLVDKANAHLAAGRYDEAEIEYKNALQLEPDNVDATGRLGSLYYDQGRLIPANLVLQKAAKLSPEDLKVRLKLANAQLALQKFAAVRTEVDFILARAPADPEAALLLAKAATTPKDLDAARLRLKQFPASAASHAAYQLALGVLEVRQENFDAAETFFKQAGSLDPKSAEAHAALAALHSTRGNPALAGPELKLAAELSPERSPWRVQYAQFLIQNGDVNGGRQLLVRMTETIPDFLPAWIHLAQLTSNERKYSEAMAMVARVLARDNIYPDAVLLHAQLRLAKGEIPKAVAELERALQFFPDTATVLYYLGLAHANGGDTRKAIETLNRTLLLAPNHTEARLLLATLNLQAGDRGPAVATLRTLVRQHPELLQPRFQLADAYRTQNNLEDALALYETIERDFPGNPRTPIAKGMVLLQQGKRADARRAFNQALERSPDFPLAVEQLVALDLVEKQFPAAQRRVEALIAKQPESAELRILAARVARAQGETATAEAALQKAIDLQPQSPTAYFMLADLYLDARQQAKALANLQRILAADPRNTKALMLSGLLNEQVKEYDAALAAYEKLLALDASFAIAHNNAAILYSERANRPDKALAAAQKARDLLPHEPHIADTLGWILLKNGQHVRALALLQESADKLPGLAEVQYHVGLAHYLLGNEDAARDALARSVRSGQDFNGLGDAKKRLALLDPAATRPALEAALAESPADPIVLLRLASLDERAGNLEKAAASYQAALQASPANLPATLALVRVHSLQKNLPKALEQARAARKLAPENPEAALALGRLSYQTKDYPRAYTLLQEAARKLPDDASALRELAAAAYSMGQVSEAESVLLRSLSLDGLSPAASEARAFHELIGLAAEPARAAAAANRIALAPNTEANAVPILMATAAADEHKGEVPAALAAYEKALVLFPDFTPAKKRLAILYAATGGDNKKALELGMKARAEYPNDAELGKALGILLHRQGEFPRALSLLRESAASREKDAELAYYLGMTHYRLKDTASAKSALQRALGNSLKADLATEANKVLAEIK